MRIALAQLAAPASQSPPLAGRAKALGYDAIELAYPLTCDPDALRSDAEAAGVEIACLATELSMPQARRNRNRAGAELRAAVDLARRVGCRMVKLFDTPVRPGQTAGGTAADMGQWLLPFADYAAERNVTLAVENAIYFRRAKDLWMLLESISHPAVAAAWDLLQGTRAGEAPSVSVPTLNLRLQYARVADVTGGAYCPLGQGEVPVEEFVRRLKGVGYGGYVTAGYGAAVPEEVLADAAVKLRAWTKPQVGASGDARPAGRGAK